MTEQKNDFGQGSVARNIMAMAVPMTVAQILNVLYNIVDRMYIGHIPGESSLALTGVGLAYPIISMVPAFSNLYGMGGAPLCSIARGEGKLDRAEAIMENAFWMLAGTGVVLTLFFLALQRPLLYAFGASGETIGYATSYLTIYLLGSLFVMIGLGMNPFINAQGFGTTGMITVALGAVINLILDPVFIFVLHMGVQGAALATIFSQFCSSVWVMKFLTGKKAILHLHLKRPKLDFTLCRQIVSLGTSSFVMNFTNSVVQIACNRQLQIYGGDLYVGVMTILNSIREVLVMPVTGLTNGAQPVLSFNYGAHKNGRVKQGIRFTTIICILYTCLAWALTLLFPGFFIRIFNEETELIQAGVGAMHIYFFGFCFMALQFSGQAVFVGLGQAKYAVFFSLLRKVEIVVPLTFLLPLIPGVGMYGVFLAEPISNVLGGCACFFTMIAVIWRRKLREDGGPAQAGAG